MQEGLASEKQPPKENHFPVKAPSPSCMMYGGASASSQQGFHVHEITTGHRLELQGRGSLHI